MLLGWERPNADKFFTVLPMAHGQPVHAESLPIERFFVADVREIELANFDRHYAGVLLKRRTDPVLARGEKLYVQSCMGCHGVHSWPAVEAFARELPLKGYPEERHRAVLGMPQLRDQDLRALLAYFHALKGEQPQMPPATAQLR